MFVVVGGGARGWMDTFGHVRRRSMPVFYSELGLYVICQRKTKDIGVYAEMSPQFINYDIMVNHEYIGA